MTIDDLDELLELSAAHSKRHHMCLGEEEDTPSGRDFSCGYNTVLTCEDCRYGRGRKDPAAKCNQL